MTTGLIARPSYDEFDLQARLPNVGGSNDTAPVHFVAKYIQMRRLRLERTHQADLDQFMRDFGRGYGTANAAMEAYFARFKRQAQESRLAYEKARASIMSDRNMDYLRKQQAIQRLNPGTEAAWTQELEDAFIRQYGDPRAQVMQWNAEMAMMMAPTIDEIVNFASVTRNRTNWERMVPWLLAHPDLDESVAPCIVIEGFGGPSPVTSALVTRELFEPPVVTGEPNPELYEAMVRAARSVCPHCKEPFPRGFASHERACARRHGVESITDAKVLEELPSLLQRQLDGREAEEDEEEEASAPARMGFPE